MPDDGATLYTLELPTLWSMFLGIINPWIIGFIVKSDWNSKRKSVIAFAIVFLSSVVGELINGRLFPSGDSGMSWRGWLSSLLYITLLTYSIYTALYKPFKVVKSEDVTVTHQTVEKTVVVGGNVTPTTPVVMIPIGDTTSITDTTGELNNVTKTEESNEHDAK